MDIFSTRFANFFARDAAGVVAGSEVDRDGLKAALLALQRRGDPASASFVPLDAVGGENVRVPVSFVLCVWGGGVLIGVGVGSACYEVRVDAEYDAGARGGLRVRRVSGL